MSQSPSDIPLLASIEQELQQLDQLYEGLQQSDLAGGILEGLGDEVERDWLQLVLLLEISNAVRGIPAGGGTTIVQPGGGGGGGQPPQVGTPNVDVDTEAIVDALEAETVTGELNVQVPADDDILNSSLEATSETAAYRVTVAFDTDVTFFAVLDDGDNAEAVALNESNALAADSLYTFDVAGVSDTIGVNFQSDTQANARVFVVKELTAAAP